jgi:radical SAM protein with 4Fe4S-binding SPASM domain
MTSENKSIERTHLQHDMGGWREKLMSHYRRGQGHLLAYIWNRFQWDYNHKLGRVPSFPLNIDIEASSTCALRCDHCFRQYMDMKEDGHMDLDLYKKVVDECAENNLFTLKFSMRGEPTASPDIVEMVQYARDKGIKEIWVNTHGGHLTDEMIRGFINAKLDALTISFDGLGEMYESVRIPLRYDRMLERLKMVSQIRKEMGSQKPRLKVQALWSSIKEDPDKFFKTMEPLVDHVAYNIDFDYKKIHLVPDPDYICYRLWQRLSVTSVGDVLKCPSDFEKDEVLGNVRTTTLKEIWDTAQEDERQRHLNGQRLQSSICEKCHHGATVEHGAKTHGGKEHVGDQIVYEDGFEGVGLNRKPDENGNSDTNTKQS